MVFHLSYSFFLFGWYISIIDFTSYVQIFFPTVQQPEYPILTIISSDVMMTLI